MTSCAGLARLCPRSPAIRIDRVGKIAQDRYASVAIRTGEFAHPKPAKPEPNRVIITRGYRRARAKVTRALTERYGEHIAGVLSCYDRILITGTLPGACFAGGMTSFLYQKGIRIFDYTKFAEPLREQIRERAHAIAAKAGITFQHIAKSHIRKEEVVAKVLAERGTHPGLVHVISAMESCDTYKPRLDKQAGTLMLRADRGQCLHYYFYFIDKEL